MGEKLRLMRVTLRIPLLFCLVYGQCSLMMLHTKCASIAVRYLKKKKTSSWSSGFLDY